MVTQRLTEMEEGVEYGQILHCKWPRRNIYKYNINKYNINNNKIKININNININKYKYQKRKLRSQVAIKVIDVIPLINKFTLTTTEIDKNTHELSV